MNTKEKIGILGTGDVARTLGKALAAHGYEIVLGSRDPSSCTLEGFTIVTLAQAAQFGKIIINGVPGHTTLETLEALDASALGEKIFIDVAVALNDDYTAIVYQDKSGAELIQEQFPNLAVVKTLCTMTSTVMVKPDLLQAPTSVFISGDQEAAKAVAKRLLADLGWDAASQIDLGGITTARGQEHFAYMYFSLSQLFGHGDFNIQVVSRKPC